MTFTLSSQRRPPLPKPWNMRTAMSVARLAPDTPGLGLRLWTDTATVHLSGDCPLLAQALEAGGGEPGRPTMGPLAVAGTHQVCGRCCSPYADEHLKGHIGDGEAHHHTWIDRASAFLAEAALPADQAAPVEVPVLEHGTCQRLTAALFDYDRLPDLDADTLAARAAAALHARVVAVLATRPTSEFGEEPPAAERRWVAIFPWGQQVSRAEILDIWAHSDRVVTGSHNVVVCHCVENVAQRLVADIPARVLSPNLPADLSDEEMCLLLHMGVVDVAHGDEAALVTVARAAMSKTGT